MKGNEKGFFLFFDWIDDLGHLDGADAWEIIKAISAYHREGVNPVELVDGPLCATVSIMFNQIKRQERISEARRNAVNTRYQNNRNFVVQNSTKRDFVVQPSTTEERNTKDYIQSFTLSGAHAHTREEETEVVENSDLPLVENFGEGTVDETDGADEETQAELRERLKRKYIGGTLGQGVVMMNDEQFAELCRVLSLEELEHYMGVITNSEKRGHHYTRRTHFEAIWDMAQKDRQTKGG